jgi:hypothetical protein
MRDWCSSCQFETYDGAEEPCYNCVSSHGEKPSEFTPKRPAEPVTNADRIRTFSDEEMANWIHQTRHNPLEDRTMNEWLVWLRQEVSKDA